MTREDQLLNRSEIIRMAREAGYQHPDAVGTCEDFAYFDLERFAALVAAASASVEREKVAAWMIQRGYATGHGDTTEDLLGELDWQVLANWSSAMKTGAENEREACAQVCDDIHDTFYDEDNSGKCAAAIRARGETTSRGQA